MWLSTIATCRALGQHGRLRSELVRLPFVVLVEERDQLAASGRQSGVARRRHPTMGLAQHTHPWTPGGDLDAAVGRAVVDNDGLDPGVRLGGDAVPGRRPRKRSPANTGTITETSGSTNGGLPLTPYRVAQHTQQRRLVGHRVARGVGRVDAVAQDDVIDRAGLDTGVL